MYVILIIVGIFVLDMIGLAVIFYIRHRRSSRDDEETSTRNARLNRREGNLLFLNGLLDRRLEEPVSALRDLGFLSVFNDLDDRELARKILQSIYLDAGRVNPFNPIPDRPTNWLSIARPFQARVTIPRFELDLLVAGEDRERVWWENLDQVQSGKDGYVRALRRWSDISRGAFRPNDIAESWGDDGEPVLITFELDGVEHVFIHLTSYNQQLDTAGLRNFVNPLIASSDVQFEIIEHNDTPNIVIALDSGERQRLAEERGWQFAEIPTLAI